MDNVRVFVGFRLPSNVVEKIVHTRRFLRRGMINEAVIRWIPKENLHITAVFLGKVEEENVHRIKLILERIKAKYKQIDFMVKNFGCWPKGKNPRIIAYQLDHPPAYARLQADLAARLAPLAPRMGSLKPAHITIGRIDKKTSSRHIEGMEGHVRKFKTPISAISVSFPALFQSILSRKGSKYKII